MLDLAPGRGVTAAPAAGATAGLGRGWTVAHAGGTEEFDGVVLAVPGAAAAALLSPGPGTAGGGLRAAHAALAAAAEALEPAPVALVHLGFASERPPRGFGLLDADGALHAIGTLFPSSMLPGRAPPGRALLTCICGGARRPERARLPDEALVEAVLGDLRRTLSLRGEPEYVRVVRWEAAIPQVTPGHGARVAAAREALRGLPPVALAGASFDGVSVPDVVRSGEAAAALLLAQLQPRAAGQG